MSLIRELRRRARQVLPQILLAGLTVYFCYHAIEGQHGILAGLRFERELAEARALDAQLAAEQARLERRVGLLRPDGLDPDMLEEQARTLLNYGRNDEYLIFTEKQGEPR